MVDSGRKEESKMKNNIIVSSLRKNQEIEKDPETLIKGVVHPKKRIYKLVLTGGPCGGKTTGQAKLAAFFESIGWKVFRVPEAATVLISGGISFGELNEEQVLDFQEHLVKTMISLEEAYFSMAEKCDQNCLIICDRGILDASAFIEHRQWNEILHRLQLDEMEICEERYNHVIHLVSAACGAEDFYSSEDHPARYEGLTLARERDRRAAEAWVDHPYVDIVDNHTHNFEHKMKRVIDLVVQRLGLNVGENFKADSRKVKFFVKGSLPDNSEFPKYTDFDVIHDYLQPVKRGFQSRLRKRGKEGKWSYTFTVRRPEKKGQIVEVKTPISKRDYENLLNYRDSRHYTVLKTRRCFLFNNQQYQLDIYREPCHERCRGLILLETFTTKRSSDLTLPPFLAEKCRDVTGDPAFSMFNLALKSDWNGNVFCQKLLHEDEDGEDSAVEIDEETVRDAHRRLVGDELD